MCVLVNNLLHKYWKPITVVFFRNESIYPKTVFTTAEDKDAKEPQFEQQKDIDKTKN